MSAIDEIKDIQRILQSRYPQVIPDGDIGPITRAAFAALDEEGDKERIQASTPPKSPQTVKASSFADPKDVAAFVACKAQGGSDLYCFARGDNGIGAWGHNTAQDNTPMAALPREIWRDAGKKGGAKIAVTYNGKRVEGILGDTMPSLKNVKNGAGIDLNPAFAKQLGLKPPFMVNGVTWEWI